MGSWRRKHAQQDTQCSEAIKAGLTTTLQAHCGYCPCVKQLKWVISVLAAIQNRGSVQSDSTSEERLQGEEMIAACRHQQSNLSMLTWGEDVKGSIIPIFGSPTLWFGTTKHFWMILIRWSQNHVAFSNVICSLFPDPCLIPWNIVANMKRDLGCSELFIISKIDIELSVNHANSSFHHCFTGLLFLNTAQVHCAITYSSCASPRQQELVHTSKKIHFSLSGVFSGVMSSRTNGEL